MAQGTQDKLECTVRSGGSVRSPILSFFFFFLIRRFFTTSSSFPVHSCGGLWRLYPVVFCLRIYHSYRTLSVHSFRFGCQGSALMHDYINNNFFFFFLIEHK